MTTPPSCKLPYIFSSLVRHLIHVAANSHGDGTLGGGEGGYLGELYWVCVAGLSELPHYSLLCGQ